MNRGNYTGKNNRTSAAVTINTGTGVSILRKGLLRAKDLRTIPKTIRLKKDPFRIDVNLEPSKGRNLRWSAKDKTSGCRGQH